MSKLSLRLPVSHPLPQAGTSQGALFESLVGHLPAQVFLIYLELQDGRIVLQPNNLDTIHLNSIMSLQRTVPLFFTCNPHTLHQRHQASHIIISHAYFYNALKMPWNDISDTFSSPHNFKYSLLWRVGPVTNKLPLYSFCFSGLQSLPCSSGNLKVCF